MPRHDLGDQLAFDIDGMIHEAEVAAAPPWEGAPLHFTVDYYSPADLEAAWKHWRFINGNFDSIARSHMWHPGSPVDPRGEGNGHSLVNFTVDLRCDRWKHSEGEDGRPLACSCVGDLLHQGICEPCEWHVIGTESQIVEAWHDHAWPGWRGLPVIPSQIEVRNQGKLSKKALAWIQEHYPAESQVDGAPIITDRGGIGTRHVPGYSPWGGFDISHTALGARPLPPQQQVVRRLSPMTGPVSEPVRARVGRRLAD